MNVPAGATGTSRSRPALQLFHDLPILVKASLAAGLLLLCLLALGLNAFSTSVRAAAGLRTLSEDLVTKQQAFSDISSTISAIHIKIFRFVSWASNGVSEQLLKPLSDDIVADLDKVSARVEALATSPVMSAGEKAALAQLSLKWRACRSQAIDTLDIGQTDAPMATMMMGQTDDVFKGVDLDFQEMLLATTRAADTLKAQLAADAERNKQAVVVLTALGLLISVGVAVAIGRLIVRPIRSITDVMQRLSAGEINVPIGHRARRDEIGRMAESIEVFRKNIIDKRLMEQTLTEAIEAVNEGFSLYDAQDRLVVCNSHYRDIFSYDPEAVVPGTTFEQILGAAIARGSIPAARGDPDWLARRLERHRAPSEPHVQRRSDGRWVRVSERRTADGGVVAIYTDITELKKREAELDAAHAEVTVLNEKLKSDNRRMEGELDVTRRLQLMLLPTSEELARIDGLEIACFMQPALEVGGDYYDVLQHDGRVKIGIGDVTGHGLESGVVMLMTQAIVRALLIGGEADHVRFLSVLNRTLHGNVRRMGSDKNLTLSLLDYCAGEIRLTGQHEQMIVVRRDGSVELVDTIDLGFPVGLEEDITPFVDQTTVRLQPGDGVVLYTDGVTEAANTEHEQYGIDRLTAVLRQNWAGSAEAVKQAVVNDVTRFIGTQTVFDDITIVVAKQT